MSGTGCFVPKIDQRSWSDPFTPQGLKQAPSPAGASFQIHECGCIRHGPEWNHRAVCSPFWRLYCNFSPGAWIESGGRKYALGPKRLVLVPDGVLFDCGSGAGVTHLWVHFSVYLSLTKGVAEVIEVPASSAALAVARDLRGAIDRTEAARAAALGAALLHLAFAEARPEGQQATPARLQKVLAWIEHSLGAEITNGELAGQAGLSVEAFIRWFKSGTGRTPAAFVAERRVREACRRLAYTEESIEQIAEAVGFANRHHFSRVFKRHAGCGPAQFRRGRR